VVVGAVGLYFKRYESLYGVSRTKQARDFIKSKSEQVRDFSKQVSAKIQDARAARQEAAAIAPVSAVQTNETGQVVAARPGAATPSPAPPSPEPVSSASSVVEQTAVEPAAGRNQTVDSSVPVEDDGWDTESTPTDDGWD
jgi:hypothetical protein